jgi:hypothetical protein
MKSVFAPVGTSCQSSSALCSLPIVLAITVAPESVTKTPQEGSCGSPFTASTDGLFFVRAQTSGAANTSV